MAVADENEKSADVSPPVPLSSQHHDPEADAGASSLSLGKDVAIGLVGECAREIDPDVEARVLRKIDWFLIPAMIVGMSSYPRTCGRVCTALLFAYQQYSI